MFGHDFFYEFVVSYFSVSVLVESISEQIDLTVRHIALACEKDLFEVVSAEEPVIIEIEVLEGVVEVELGSSCKPLFDMLQGFFDLKMHLEAREHLVPGGRTEVILSSNVRV